MTCTHGPKKDCAQCLVLEMAAVLEDATSHVLWFTAKDWEQWVPKARAVLEKAKKIQEASR